MAYKPKYRCASPAAAKRNLRQAVKAFAAWQKQHIKRCGDYTGTCCAGCHDADDLYVIELGEDVAYVCCLMRIKNKLGIEDEGQALHVARDRHAVTPKPEDDNHDAEVIVQLPPGLLRTYLIARSRNAKGSRNDR